MNPELVHSLNSLRILSADMISYAGSGHPGICLGAAPALFTLYANHLKINPADPKWPNRDRFVLSCGHASALLYAMLFMAGYDVSIDDLVDFRKIGSKTPGHPEYGITPGVDVSTGDLGEGIANAVGMAIAEKYLSGLASSEITKQKIVNYYVYCMVSDGDLMEGVAQEAMSIAGHLALDNLIVLYDSNSITLDGELNKSFSENILQKLINIGWEVDFVAEGNDTREIDKAINRAKINKKPTLIEIKTVIGRGSYHEGKNLVHGTPLTREDLVNIRKKYNINTNTMEITESAVKFVRDSIKNRMGNEYNEWTKYVEVIKANPPSEEITKLINFLQTGEDGLTFSSANFKIQNDYNEQLRESNSKILNIVSDRTKFFMGGSADVANSAHTSLYKETEFSKKNRIGKILNFGVREHAMGAILNGLSLSGLRVYGSTFLVFSDFLKPALRMSCLMNLPITYIFTHDSVSIGPDGPTHQPVEQLAMLRTTPNLTVLRPADIKEVIGSWDYIVNNKKPVALVLSKDTAHILAGTDGASVSKGAYIIKKEDAKIDAVLVSTGIDLTTTYLIKEELKSKGIDTRLVSMPSVELFLSQPQEYQDEIIPPDAKVFTIEASSTLPWYRFASKGCAIGIDTFGLSGQKDDVLEKLHFDYESILSKIETNIKGKVETNTPEKTEAAVTSVVADVASNQLSENSETPIQE